MKPNPPQAPVRPASETPLPLLGAVFAVGAVGGLLVAAAISPRLALPHANPTRIVGPLDAVRYAKANDYLRAALLLGFGLGGGAVAWAIWRATARALAWIGSPSVTGMEGGGAARLASAAILLLPACWAFFPPGRTAGSPLVVLALVFAPSAGIAGAVVLLESWRRLRARDRGPFRTALLAAGSAGASFALAARAVGRIPLREGWPFLRFALVCVAAALLAETLLASRKPGLAAGRLRVLVWTALALAGPLALAPLPSLARIGLPLLVAAVVAALGRSGRMEIRGGLSRPIALLAPCLPLWALLAQTLLASVHAGDVDLYHEGESLGPADAYLRGEVPYRDAFVLHGYFWNGGFARIAFAFLGATIEARRVADALAEPLGAVGLLALAFAATRSRLFALVGTLVALGAVAGAGARQGIALASLACLVAGVGRRGVALFFAAGALGFASLLVSLEAGLYALLSGLAFAAIYGFSRARTGRVGPRPALAFGLGAAAAALPWGLWLAAQHAVVEFLEVSLLDVPRYQTAIWGIPAPDSLRFLGALPVLDRFFPMAERASFEGLAGPGPARFARDFLALPALLLVGVVFLGARAAARRFRDDEWRFLAILLASLVAYRSALGRADRVHFAFAFPWAWTLALVLADRSLAFFGRSSSTETAPAAPLLPALVLAALGAFAAAGAPAFHWANFAAPPPASLPPADPELPKLGRVAISPEQRSSLLALKGFFDENAEPGEPVFDAASQGAILFLLDRPNPTRFAQALHAASPAFQDEVVGRLEARRVRFAIARGGAMSVVDGIGNEERLPRIFAHLRERFEPAATVGGFEIWKRKE